MKNPRDGVRLSFAEIPTDLDLQTGVLVLPEVPIPTPDGSGIATGISLDLGCPVFVVLRKRDGHVYPLGVWSTIEQAIDQQASGLAMVELFDQLNEGEQGEVRTMIVAAATDGRRAGVAGAHSADALRVRIDQWCDEHGKPQLCALVEGQRERIRRELAGTAFADEAMSPTIPSGKKPVVH